MKTRWISLAVLTATVGLLGLLPAAQAELRVGQNYKLDDSKNSFRGEDQTGLAVNPSNPQHVVQVNADYWERTCESSVSFDGGKTWSDAVPLQQPAPKLLLEPAFNPSCQTNQSVEFGSDGNVYTATAASRTEPAFPDTSVLLFRSTDGGQTWQPGVVALPGGPGRTATTEKQVGPSYTRPSVSVDRERATPADTTDRIYVSAHDFTTNPNQNVRVAVSDDNGETFSPPVKASPETSKVFEPSEPVVNKDGTITIVWRTLGTEGVLQATRSADGGQTWSEPVDVAKVKNTGTTVGARTVTSPSSTASYPRLAGDPTTDGKLYLVYAQGSTGPAAPEGGYKGADHFISPDDQVWVQRSTDAGATWSEPKLLSEQTKFPGSRTHQTRQGSVSVSPNGRINVVWHDRRHWFQGPGERNCTHSHIFCEEIRLGDTYYSYSTNGGDSYSKPIRITDRSLNVDTGHDGRGSLAYWNYGPQSVTVGADQQQLVGWMDSREGNWDTDTEDSYLAKVDFNASGAAPETNINQPDAVARSVALSKLGYQGGNEGALVGGLRRLTAPLPGETTTRPPDITSSPDPACPDPATTTNCPGGVATRNTSAVVIVNENDAAGALAGAVLARANPASVLLSPAAGLPQSVKDEVSRIRPGGAFVIGDSDKLSDQVVQDLRAAGVPDNPPATRGQGGERKITRLSGANAAETAKAIAEKMDYRTPAEKTAGNPAFDAAVIANADSKDAGAVAGLAAARRLPVLFVDQNSIPSDTTAALDSLKIDNTLVIGGPSAVSDEVKDKLPSAKRLGGADQYETSKAVVAESKDRGLPGNVVYGADGTQPMDAALLGGVAARATGMLVLAPAPVSRTAAGQAADFGLTGVDRFFLVGAPRDTEAPAAPTITSPANNSYDTDGNFLVAGTAEPGSTVRLYEGTTLRGTATATGGGVWGVALRGVANGRHTYTALATDAEGNTSSPAAPRTVIVDTVKPTVRAVSPRSNATGVSTAANVLATFSEPMRASTVNRITVRLVRRGTTRAISARVTYDALRRRATLNPTSALARRTTYTATVTTGARDAAGNPLARTTSWSFRTR